MSASDLFVPGVAWEEPREVPMVAEVPFVLDRVIVVRPIGRGPVRIAVPYNLDRERTIRENRVHNHAAEIPPIWTGNAV